MGKEPISNCCGEKILEDSDVCSKCKEHCSAQEIIDEVTEELENKYLPTTK